MWNTEQDDKSECRLVGCERKTKGAVKRDRKKDEFREIAATSYTPIGQGATGLSSVMFDK